MSHPSYSVRRASDLFKEVFQIRLKNGVRDLEIVGNTARCLYVSKQTSTLVDIDLASGSEIRRVENLPLLGDTQFAPDGRGIGICRTAAVGQGPTLIRFLDAAGRVAAESSIPDATSDIAAGPETWYVGCRNGSLYAFGLDGNQLWEWETPGSGEYTGNAYFRPCPYFVSSRQSFAAVASMGNIYSVSPNGDTLWHTTLPNEKQTRWEFTIPFPNLGGSRDPYSVLGLTFDAPREKVKAAYRRFALATHPDRNPHDEDATAKFRTIQEAYERILAGQVVSGKNAAGFAVSIEMLGAEPTASFLAASTTGVVVGSTQGRLYTYDEKGRLCEARVLGDGPVRMAFRPDGTLGAAWCSDTLLFFQENRVVNAAEALSWPRDLTMLGNDVVLWSRNEVQVMDAYGKLLWSVEFSKSVTRVFAHRDMLVCVAGVVTAFRRHSS